MDVLKFLQQGNVSKNPDYNPKTKEGKTKSPLLVDYNVGENISDKLRKNITSNLSKNIYSLNTDDIDKYAEYDVYLNTYDSQEQLNKERAENQSAVEQLGRAVTQAVGNEVVLGTLLGVSNIVDFFANIGREEGLDDYTNPVSTQLENWQNQIRDRFEIYQKDPNASWAIGDFGWWANNAVSIASTASMLLPSTGIVKGLSALGKFKTIGKITNKSALLAGKAAKQLGIGNSAVRNAQALKSSTEIGLTALASRTMEGYLEAKGVYDESKQETIDKLSSMSNEEFNQFIKRNPQFENKTIDEIASYIASISADETFANDYAMLLMDVAQFKALGSMWKGLPNKTPSAALRVENKKAIKSLLGDVVEEGKDIAKKQGFGSARLDIIKETLKNPLTTIGAIEWSEGLEEAYQGIQTEKGKEVAKMILDPNYNPRSIESYIADPAIWEQAFWGVLGGVGFQAVGSGLGNLYRRVDAKLNKDKYSDQDIDRLLTSEEKVRKAEIDGRNARISKFSEDIALVQQGLSPDEYELDERTGKPVVEDGIVKRKELTKSEQEIKKTKLVNDLLTEMATEAIDVGNYDLLIDYLSSDEFNKFLKQAGVTTTLEDKEFNQRMIEKMNEVSDIYSRELYNILSNTEVEHESIAKILAREVTRERLTIQEYDSKIIDLENQINAINTGNQDSINKYKTKVINDRGDSLLQDLDDLENQYYELYRQKVISQQAFDQYKKDIQTSRDAITNYQNANKNIIDYSNVPDALDSVKDLIDQIVEADIQKALINEILPSDNKGYDDRADDIRLALDRKIKTKYDDAAKKVEQWIKNQDNIDAAKEAIYTNNVPELKEELDILKIGHTSTREFTASIDAVFAEERNNRQQEATPKLNGKVVSKPVAYSIDNQSTKLEETSTNIDETQIQEEDVEQTSLSTGEETEITQEVPKIVVISKDEAESLAQKTFFELFNNDKQLFENITEESTQKIIDIVADRLKEEGYVDGDINQIVVKTFNTWLKLAQRILKKKGSDKLNDIETLLSIINTKVNVEIDDDTKNAITKLLTGSELNKVIDEFLKQYVEKQNIAVTNGKKTVISLEKLFKTIIEDYDIDVDTAMHILLNMKEFITSDNHNYIFKEKQKLNNILKNPDVFFDKVINSRSKEVVVDNYMHISATNEKVRHDDYDKTINSLVVGDELTVTSGTFGKHHSPTTLNITKNGVPIGYITKVNPTKDNTGYSLQISENSTDLRYIVRKNADGTIISNTDDLFNEFFENKELFDILSKYYILSLEGKTGVELTKEEADIILNNPVVKQAIANKVIVFNIQANTNERKAKVLLDKLKNVVFYNNDSETISDFKDSYSQWIEKMYYNFENTHKIQNAVENGQTPIIRYGGMGGNIKSYQDSGLIRRNIEWGIENIKSGLFYDKHPIVIVSRNGFEDILISEEKGSTAIANRTAFGIGTMGMKIGGTDSNPHLVIFSSGRKVNGIIKSNLIKELTSLIKRYQSTDSDKITYEELKEAISNLYNGYDSKSNFGKDSLFRGIELYEKDGKLHLLKHYKDEDGVDRKSLLLSIHKYEKDNKQLSTGIYYATGLAASTKFNDKMISKIVTDIVDSTIYNATFYSVDHINEDNHKTNPYFYKENGKLIVEIGGNKQSYDNFGHFVLANNAFNTTQGINAQGGFYNNTEKIKSLYIEFIDVEKPDSEISPVEGTISIESVITSATTKEFKSTRNLLNVAGNSKADIDFLLGDNPYKIALISSEFGYGKSKNVQGYYKDGKIYFGKLGVTSSKNNPNNVKRILIHESLHEKFANSDIFEQERIVNGLIDTYDETVKAVDDIISKENKDSDSYKLAVKIKELLNTIKKSYGKDKQVFAEEWLTECLSQKELMNFLNNTKYGKGNVVIDNIKTEDKSIWQKIIDLLLKLFGINNGNIKNNTIFAQQYLLLSSDIKVDSSKEIEPVIQEESVTQEEIEDDVVADVLGESVDQDRTDIKRKGRISTRKFAITSDITKATDEHIDNIVNNDGNATAETFGVTRVSNMNDYINTFPIQDQQLIAKMVENGELQWVCR